MKKEEHGTYLQMCKMQQTRKQHTGTEQTLQVETQTIDVWHV